MGRVISCIKVSDWGRGRPIPHGCTSSASSQILYDPSLKGFAAEGKNPVALLKRPDVGGGGHEKGCSVYKGGNRAANVFAEIFRKI